MIHRPGAVGWVGRKRWVLLPLNPSYKATTTRLLPLVDPAVDRVLMSLVIHQIAHREQALQEVYRVLHPGGRVLVRAVTPEVALQARVPFRFFPKVAHVFVH